MARRICVFDLETRLLSTDLSPDKEKGWAEIRRGKGGISALVIYDSLEGWVFNYDDCDILEIASHLESADTVIGFNSKFFDIPVVEGVLGRMLKIAEHIDLSDLIQKSLMGLNIPRRKGENTLDAVCKRTLGRGKIDHGSNIKTLIADGKWGNIFRYCADDVRLTKDLYRHVRDEGGVISVNETLLPIALPPHLLGQAHPSPSASQESR